MWAALLPALGALLARVFSSKIGQWAVSLLLFFGVQLAVTGSVGVPDGAFIRGQLSSLLSASGATTAGQTALQMVGALKFDVFATIIISAYTAKFALAAGRMFFKRA